jgi:hypothetical protein
MLEVFVPVALSAALSLGPAAPVRGTQPGVLAAAVAKAFSPRDEMLMRSKELTQDTRRDSLSNGAVTGAIAGGLGGVVLGALGCAVGDAVSQSWGGESSGGGCAGPVILLGAAGAGIGALIGVGVDAMFEQTPQVAGIPAGRRKGVRVRWRF